MNAYDILECTQVSSHEEIKSSYHRLLLIHHPDKKSQQDHDQNVCPIDGFLKLQSAFKILSDKTQRLAYDSLLKQIDLTNKANDIELNDDDDESSSNKCFMLSKDFELNNVDQNYRKKCRCGSYYKINVKDLNRILESHQSLTPQNSSPSFTAESLVISVECDTCSLNINVLTI
jgi:diphthamide biosynthesis protein 4